MLKLVYVTYDVLVTPRIDDEQGKNTPSATLKNSQRTQSIGTVCDAREPHNHFMKGAP